MNRKSTEEYVRVANHNGVTIREGTEEDIGLFFNLMVDTCKRQGVKPNPPTEKALRQLWLTFSRRNCLRVTFAEYNHEVLAGSLNIIFGKKVNLWKKGWNFKHPESSSQCTYSITKYYIGHPQTNLTIVILSLLIEA